MRERVGHRCSVDVVLRRVGTRYQDSRGRSNIAGDMRAHRREAAVDRYTPMSQGVLAAGRWIERSTKYVLTNPRVTARLDFIHENREY